ncbi:MAG: hypothetical protein C4527_06180 [Candidatus Omnitrophota bacterium]|jgi:flagellar motor switch protein FliM|nr:MAG: hypothetical protein C4527_06180 [Candidatus Omnitrophota bacterium]
MEETPEIEKLSKKEIDDLLSQFAEKEKETEADADQVEADLYYFNPLTQDQVDTLHSIHQHVARLFSGSLLSFLRCESHVDLVSTDQITYEEFYRSLPNPTFIVLLTVEPIGEKMVVEFSPTVSFPVIDRLAGGYGNVFLRNRESTELEEILLEKVVYRLLDCLQEAWAPFFRLTFHVEEEMQNPAHLLGLYPNGGNFVLDTLEVRIREISGTVSIGYPFPVLSPIRTSFSQWCRNLYSEMAYRSLSSRLRNGTTPVFTAMETCERVLFNDIRWFAVGSHDIQPFTVGKVPIVRIGEECKI